MMDNDSLQIGEQYLSFRIKTGQGGPYTMRNIRRVVLAFCDHLEVQNIKVCNLKIEQIDAFLAQYTAGLGRDTSRVYRSHLRGFLKYLYQQRKILKRDLAPLVVGPPNFAQRNPPKFLRPHQVQQLLAQQPLDTPLQLCTYATLHLACFLGLRPREISLLTLDDIAFQRKELTITNRKNNNPLKLPLPDDTIKAIAAYLVGGRPQSGERRLFLSVKPPHRALSPFSISQGITKCIRKAGFEGTAYWLRHTYAQYLLESGADIYEIKEMLGHDNIESTRKYLHVHIQLMRKVLFDETL